MEKYTTDDYRCEGQQPAFFAPGGKSGSGSSLWLDACAPVSAACRWVIPGVYFSVKKAIEEAMWATPGLGKAGVLQDTRSCEVPRPSDDSKDTES